MTKSNPKEADNYHYFSYDTKAGTAGIARQMGWGGGKVSGSVCWEDKYRRTGISEWMRSDVNTAIVSNTFRVHDMFLTF